MILSWLAEILPSAFGPAQVRLSTDERCALRFTNQINKVFVQGSLEPMGRREVFRNVTWIWKSARVVTLRSGRFALVPWLLLFWLTCLCVVAKTVLAPNSRDLGILLGGHEFLMSLQIPIGCRK